MMPFTRFNFTRFALRPTVCEIQGCRKSEMHPMTSDWAWSLNYQRYPEYTKYLPMKPKFPSVSLYVQPFARHKIVSNRKCTGWLQIDLGHLAVKGALNTYPKFHPFCCISSHVITRLSNIRMYWMTWEWPWTLSCQKYHVHTEYLAPMPKFSSVSLLGQSFRDTWLRKIWNALNDLRMTLST